MGPPASGTAHRRGFGKGIFGVPGPWILEAPAWYYTDPQERFFLGKKLLECVRQHPQMDGDARVTSLGRQWLWSGIPVLVVPHRPQRLAPEGSLRAWG